MEPDRAGRLALHRPELAEDVLRVRWLAAVDERLDLDRFGERLQGAQADAGGHDTLVELPDCRRERVGVVVAAAQCAAEDPAYDVVEVPRGDRSLEFPRAGKQAEELGGGSRAGGNVWQSPVGAVVVADPGNEAQPIERVEVDEALVAAGVAGEWLGPAALVELADANPVPGVGREVEVLRVGLAEQPLRDLGPTLAAAVARYASVLFDPLGEVNERGTVEL